MLQQLLRRSGGHQSFHSCGQSFRNNVTAWAVKRNEELNAQVKSRNVLIYGAGAVGAVVAWRLAQIPNVCVSVVCRSNYEAVTLNGFHISTRKWGPGHFIPQAVYRSPLEACGKLFDYVLCTNKSTTGIASSYNELRAVTNGRTAFLALQNGVDVEAPLRGTFPNNTIISGIVYFNSRQLSPGLISQESSIRSYPVGLAVYDRRKAEFGVLDDEKLAEFVQLTGGEFQPLNDAVSERWVKQLWNGVFNPLCAIYKLNTHDLLHQPSLARRVSKAMEEIYIIAAASGASIDPTMPQRLMDVTKRSPPIVPSMLQDVLVHRSMEIESLCGKFFKRVITYQSSSIVS
ncbi:unnamed protein product [Penicillium nalgiovense]|nr:unnamed protein product [Penicillium nalgiovense]